MIDLTILALLGCINLDISMYQHIHVLVTGIEIPKYMNVIPYYGGIDSCMREMHTHGDVGVIHIESNTPKNFTLRDFFQHWFNDDWGNQTPIQLSNITINDKPADIDTPLKDNDLVNIY